MCQLASIETGRVAYRSGDISTGDTLRGGIEEIERWGFTDLGNDL